MVKLLGQDVLSKKYRRRLFSIVMPYYSGKTTLRANLEAYKSSRNKEIFFIDVDDLVEKKLVEVKGFSNDESLKKLVIFPKIKEEVLNMLRNYPYAYVVIITSNRALIKFMGIKDKRNFVFAPTLELFDGLIKGLADSDLIKKLGQSREDLIVYYARAVQAFSKIEDLTTKVAQLFDLVKRL